jgi:hypothetical protein
MKVKELLVTLIKSLNVDIKDPGAFGARGFLSQD